MREPERLLRRGGCAQRAFQSSPSWLLATPRMSTTRWTFTSRRSRQWSKVFPAFPRRPATAPRAPGIPEELPPAAAGAADCSPETRCRIPGARKITAGGIMACRSTLAAAHHILPRRDASAVDDDVDRDLPMRIGEKCGTIDDQGQRSARRRVPPDSQHRHRPLRPRADRRRISPAEREVPARITCALREVERGVQYVRRRWRRGLQRRVGADGLAQDEPVGDRALMGSEAVDSPYGSYALSHYVGRPRIQATEKLRTKQIDAMRLKLFFRAARGIVTVQPQSLLRRKFAEGHEAVESPRGVAGLGTAWAEEETGCQPSGRGRARRLTASGWGTADCTWSGFCWRSGITSASCTARATARNAIPPGPRQVAKTRASPPR